VSSAIGSLWYSASLFLAVVSALLIGRRVGARRSRDDAEGARAGVGAVEGAVFGLMGLLIAFTFSGAAARFDARRDLIVDEANAIGTAWLRIDLLPASAQPALRQAFRDYLDSRIATYRHLSDPAAAKQEATRSTHLQGEIWALAVAAGREPGMQQATMLLLPALNEMIDITTTRAMAIEMHPPQVVFGMLFSLTVVAALLAGTAMGGGRSPSWLHMIGFAAVMAISAYVILDMEFPRRGLIRIDRFDHLLVDLRATMN
jgi:hypothetical protein